MLEPSFPYTFESGSVAELQDQSASWSYTIRLPRSANNEKILESAGAPFSNTRTPYRRIQCNVYADGIQTISNGVMFIDTTTDTEYQVQIISGNADVFEKLGDIEFENWENADIITLPQKTLSPLTDDGTSIFVYPRNLMLSKNSFFVTNALIDRNIYYYASPLIRVGRTGKENSLLHKVLTEIGYTLETDTPNDVLDNLYMSLEGRERYDDTDEMWISESVSIAKNYGSTINYINPDVMTFHATFAMRCQLRISGNYTDASGNVVSAFTALNAFFMGSLGMTNALTLIAFDDNGKELGRRQFTDSSEFVNGELNIDLDIESIDRAVGVRVIVTDEKWYINNGVAPKEYTSLNFAFTSSRLVLKAKENVAVSGQRINLEANLPFTTAQDFFKMLTGLFGWIVNVKNGVIQAHSFGYVKGRKHLAQDWSDKVAMSDTKQMQFVFGDYAQENIIQLKENEVSGYTDKVAFPIDNANIAKTKDILDIDATSGNGMLVETWDYNEDVELKYVGKGMHLITFDGENIGHYTAEDIKANYMPLADSLQNMKVLTLKMVLSSTDIRDFNPYTPIFLRQFGAYYYVNKIDQWEEGKVASVELLEL